MNKNFEFLCRFLGWGDPKDGLWFVGMEEAGTWCSRSQLRDFKERESLRQCQIFDEMVYFDSITPENRTEHVSGGRSRNQIRNFQSYIAMRFSKTAAGTKEAYRERRLWCENSGVFQSNVFPLGKPKTRDDFPALYKTLFGYGPANYATYVQDTRQLRFDLIRKFKVACQPQAIVCFGKTFWNYAAEIFELGEIGDYDNNIAFFDQQRVVLTPFLGQGMSYEQANTVTRKLTEWNISLP